MALSWVAAAPWWWSTVLFTVVLVGLAVLLAVFSRGSKQVVTKASSDQLVKHDRTTAGGKLRPPKASSRNATKLEEEPWIPKLEVKDWQEACELSGCPWDFEGCETVEDALRRVWRPPLDVALRAAFNALSSKVTKLRVARVHLGWVDEVRFAIVYALDSGSELFGGEPYNYTVGVQLEDFAEEDDEDEEEAGGLRRRRRSGAADTAARSSAAPLGPRAGVPGEGPPDPIPLACLAPFFRIHDGFGSLLATKHLPLLLASPGDSIMGSCFYVYPVRELEPLARRPSLIKFARVDKHCVACAQAREAHPCVMFAELTGDIVEDDEAPLDFVADTVCNISGHKVVPGPEGSYGYDR